MRLASEYTDKASNLHNHFYKNKKYIGAILFTLLWLAFTLGLSQAFPPNEQLEQVNYCKIDARVANPGNTYVIESRVSGQVVRFWGGLGR